MYFVCVDPYKNPKIWVKKSEVACFGCREVLPPAGNLVGGWAATGSKF